MKYRAAQINSENLHRTLFNSYVKKKATEESSFNNLHVDKTFNIKNMDTFLDLGTLFCWPSS